MRVLDSSYHTVREVDPETDEETTRDVVRHVTFVDHIGSVHTLTFHPEGTPLHGAAEGIPRKVGDPGHPVHTFETADDAMNAFYRGDL